MKNQSRTRPAAWLQTIVATFALMLISAVGSPASADSPEELRVDYSIVNAHLDNILSDIRIIQRGFKTSYDCPPEETKKPDQDLLDAVSRRINSERIALGGEGRNNGLIERNELLGKVGMGQGSDRYFNEDRASAQDNLTIPQASIRALQAKLQQARTALNNARSDLNGRPKSRQDCNANSDPITSITYNPPSMKPGSNVTAGVSVTTRSGNPFTITNITLNAGTAGTTTGTTNNSASFKIDDIKRHGPHTLTVTVTGRSASMPASAGTTSKTQTFTYYVLNEAPTIVSVPPDVKKKPGEPVSYSGQIVVRDTNADRNNPNEVPASSVKFTAHPTDLETNPGSAFDRFDRVRRTGHNPATGEITFTVSRNATAKKPHKHGIFKTSIEIADSKGSKASKNIQWTIENVAPVGTMQVSPKRAYHAGDGIKVSLSGTVRDDNGRDDIEKIEVDATKAGGGLYTKANGKLVLTNDGDTGYTWVTNPADWGHTNNPGRHPIPATAEDNGAPEQGQNTPEKHQFDKDITVGNDPPRDSGGGYIYDSGPEGQRRICPGQVFTAGVIFIDPEGDTLDVTAGITQTVNGQTVEVQKGQPMIDHPNSNTFTLGMRAPSKPGTYTIVFTATEKNIKPARSDTFTMTLVVDPCPDQQDQIALNDPRVDPDDDQQDDANQGGEVAVCGGVVTDAEKEQIAMVSSGEWTRVFDQSPATQEADDWGMSVGLRYEPEEFIKATFKPVIDWDSVSFGADTNGDGQTDAIGELTGRLQGNLRAAFDEQYEYDDYDEWLEDLPPQVKASLMLRARAVVNPANGQNAFDSGTFGEIFTDGFESGDTSAWSSAIDNGSPNRSSPANDNTFGNRVRLSFDTSFTGKDVLRTRLENNRNVTFVEDTVCRKLQTLRQGADAYVQVRQPAPSAEGFISLPDGKRDFDPQTDGRQPAITDADPSGQNIINLLNQEYPRYHCGELIEVVVADGECNQVIYVIGQ